MVISPNLDNIPADQRARRARSFGGQAAAYAQHRPGYPLTAIRWALQPLGENRATEADSRLRVLDLAAGTGKLTESLVASPPEGEPPLVAGHPEGLDVVAVEPDDDMRAELSRLLPGVPAHAGTAEDIPLPDASVDAVLVGQAMHWFDLDRALPEIARVLRPGGVLAGLWNDDDERVDWVVGFDEVVNGPRAARSQGSRGLPDDHPEFTPFARERFANPRRHTIDSLLATTATHSQLLVLPEDERAALLDRMRDYLRSRPETSGGEFDQPLLTVVARAVRRS
ncbi:class I SAM-dependent methyltransferase [Goodfellowiella coeruleoviolacea]|uniref:Methylase involved in ubiquinone/menaquinone biosynthesis n=1 Tax=Goodfellowiella coeruleoviolacea TaxID=334858 RepID=A0AAE3GC41_9PSEU|nr:class I SAM-dependent methyltransferase [Goodfellowiella coeruleoviolacea]MCP2164685.1 Methylase involved in ubiquinone/menaquinone biosynthesis [Goodfellowiella coeruleoviolacea]